MSSTSAERNFSLNRHRVLLPDRLDEPVHEAFGGEVADAPPRLAAADAPRGRVQEVGLAKADATVEIERVERKVIDARDLLRRRVGEFVGLADDEFAEGEAAVERRTEISQRPALCPRNVTAAPPGCGRLAGRARLALACLRLPRMDHDAGALDAVSFFGPERRDAMGIARSDPVAEEARADAEGDLITVDSDQDERRQPAREGGLADLREQARAHPVPGVLPVSGRRRRVVRHGRDPIRRLCEPREHGPLRRRAASRRTTQ